ncbi:MAG: hypothetical protein GXN94_00720 [Aquificae bacterium]|nr:hypothetical protein [Aquificota bacterium]
MSEGKKGYPFALVGFFITDKEAEDSIRVGLDPEEVERVNELIKKTFFKEGVDVVVTPFVVPPDQVKNALDQLAEVLFSSPEEEKGN